MLCVTIPACPISSLMSGLIVLKFSGVAHDSKGQVCGEFSRARAYNSLFTYLSIRVYTISFQMPGLTVLKFSGVAHEPGLGRVLVDLGPVIHALCVC